MKVPKIYDHFTPGQLFTMDEAREKLGTSGNTLRKRLSELAARNYILPIRQGLYRMNILGDLAQLRPLSPFAIAAKLAPYCYLGFKSALEFHAKETPAENQTIYVVSPTKFNQFKFEKRLFYWCQSSEKNGVEDYTLEVADVPYQLQATNFEKSIIDCLKRPGHCPSFLELLRLCEKIAFLPDIDKMMFYMDGYNIQSLFNRIGFLFEKNRERWNIPPSIFTAIENKMSSKPIEWPIFLAPVHQNWANIGLQAYHDAILEGKRRWKIHFHESTP